MPFIQPATIARQFSVETSATSNLSLARLELSKGVKAIPNFLLDYAEIIDAATFEVAEDSTENCRAIVAGWINGIRLIDNMAMPNLGNSK